MSVATYYHYHAAATRRRRRLKATTEAMTTPQESLRRSKTRLPTSSRVQATGELQELDEDTKETGE